MLSGDLFSKFARELIERRPSPVKGRIYCGLTVAEEVTRAAQARGLLHDSTFMGYELWVSKRPGKTEISWMEDRGLDRFTEIRVELMPQQAPEPSDWYKENMLDRLEDPWLT